MAYSKRTYARLFPAIADDEEFLDTDSGNDDIPPPPPVKVAVGGATGFNYDAKPAEPTAAPEYYPNGVRKRAMDERLPDGRTINESLDSSFLTRLMQRQLQQPNPESPSIGNGRPQVGYGLGEQPNVDDDNVPKDIEPQDELAKSRAAANEAITRKIIDKDHGFWARFKEIAGGAVEGAAQVYRTNPHASVWEELAGAGAGAGAAAIDKTWNERRAQERDIATTSRNYAIQSKLAKDKNDLENDANERYNKTRNSLTAAKRLEYDNLKDEQKQLLDVYKEADDFDPKSKDPAVQKILARAEQLGVTLLAKRKGERFTFHITPDGKLIVGNTATGQFLEGKGDYSKPTPTKIDPGAIEKILGVKSDKEIDDESEAQIKKENPTRARIPDVEKALLEMKDENGKPLYQNEDGSLNEAQAYADRVTEPSKLYRDNPSDYDQRKASYRVKARASQAELKRQAATLNAAIENQNPKPNAKPVPVSKVADTIRKIMALPPKVRAQKLKIFYDNLSNIRITG